MQSENREPRRLSIAAMEDMPDVLKEREKCLKFLSNFGAGQNEENYDSRKYMDQLVKML